MMKSRSTSTLVDQAVLVPLYIHIKGTVFQGVQRDDRYQLKCTTCAFHGDCGPVVRAGVREVCTDAEVIWRVLDED